MVMRTYSLDFLQEDWEGAGFDFCIAAVFDACKLNSHSIRQFVIGVSDLAQISLRFIANDDPHEWQAVGKDELMAFLDTRFQWEATQLLVVDLETKHGFLGYAEINQTDQLVIGGPSDNYYKGSIEHDEALATDIVAILAVAIGSFGEAYGCFGAGSNAMAEAEKLRGASTYPNLSQPLGAVLEAQITSKCREIRELSEE
jgi:hypothetical protein